MKQKIKNWIVAKAMTNPALPIQVLYYTYLVNVTISFVLFALAFVWPWFFVIGLFSMLFTFGLGTTGFVVLMEFTKSMTVMKDINMEEVMVLANSLFGNMPVKPTGPIGVVDNEPSRK